MPWLLRTEITLGWYVMLFGGCESFGEFGLMVLGLAM